MLAHSADSTRICFAHGSLRPFYVNDPLAGRLKPTRLRLCMTTSSRVSSMTSSRLASSSVVHDRHICSLTPTAGLPSALLAARNGLFVSFSPRRHCIWQSRSAASASAAGDTARKSWYDQRRCYRQLRNQKCVSFWSDKLTSAKSPRDMWSTVDRLMGRGRRACDAASADDSSKRWNESGRPRPDDPSCTAWPVSYTHLTLPTILRV